MNIDRASTRLISSSSRCPDRNFEQSGINIIQRDADEMVDARAHCPGGARAVGMKLPMGLGPRCVYLHAKSLILYSGVGSHMAFRNPRIVVLCSEHEDCAMLCAHKYIKHGPVS